MSDDTPKSTDVLPTSDDRVKRKSLESATDVVRIGINPALTNTAPRLEESVLSNGNGTTNGDNGRSDSEAETVVLDGKEEGATTKVIKHEDASDVEGNPAPATTIVKDRKVLAAEDGHNGVRKPSLKRKRVVQESALNEALEAGNSSNLSSTFSSPAPQLRSDGGNKPDSDHLPSVAEETREKKSRLRRRKLEPEDEDSTRQRRGKSDPSLGTVNGQERRGKRRVKDYSASSTRSESPPTHQHPSSHLTQSSSIPSGVKRRKAPPLLSVERRRKASEDTHLESDDSTSAHSRPHLQKSASIDEHAMSKSHKKILDRSGRTPVARACANDNIQQLEIELKERPHHLNEPDYAQNNPLQIAALEGFVDTVQYLLDQGCIINCKNIEGDTPLMDAIENGHLGVVTQLLKAGADPRLRNGEGKDILDLVKSENDKDGAIRDALVAAKEKGPQRRSSEDQTITNRDNDGASASVSAGSPTDSTQGKGPLTGSETARQGQGGRASLGNETTRRKTARSQTTRDGLLWVSATPERLREAASKGDIEVVGHILNSRPADTESMLLAARGGHDVVLQLLIALGRNSEPDPEPLQSSDYKPGHDTPMLAAIGGGNVKVVELLLKQSGFDPTRRMYRGYTYYELAKQRQSSNWQQEYHILKEAYDNYTAETGGRSTNGSPRKIRTKRADRPSSPSAQAHRARPVDGLKRQSSHRSHSRKQVRSDDERKDAAAVTSDREAGNLGPPGAKIRSGARSASDAGAVATLKLETNPKPRRRLLSKNEISDQDNKRRASSALERSPSSTHEKSRRQSSDPSTPAAPDRMVENISSSPTKHEEVTKKRPRDNSSPHSGISESQNPHHVERKKKRRVDSHGSAVEPNKGETPSRGPAMVANMIACPEPTASPINAPGTAPVAFMGGNSSSSPKVRSPEDTKPSIKSLFGSIDRTLHQDHPRRTSQSPKQAEDFSRNPTFMQGTSSRSNETSTHKIPNTAGHDQDMIDHDKEARDREAQAKKDERERQDQLRYDKEAQGAREREIEAVREREREQIQERERAAEAHRQRQAEEAREEEASRLKAQQEAEELERQMQTERQEEEAREAKKRTDELLARRAEQERQQREKEERRRADLEHREQMRRIRLQEEKEQQRREALPHGLRHAAELSPEDARDPEWINKWLPLYTVETQDLDPGCAAEDALERWVSNVQVAPLLAITDLELSQCMSIPQISPSPPSFYSKTNLLNNPPPPNTDTAWTHRPVLTHERASLWRLLRNQQAGVRIPSLRATTDEKTLFSEARAKFFTLQPLFWVRYADFVDIVPRHPHLSKGLLYTRAMAVQALPVGQGAGKSGEEGGFRGGEGVLMNGAPNGAVMNGHL